MQISGPDTAIFSSILMA